MGDREAGGVRRLRKSDAEMLMTLVDSQPIDVLTRVLAKVLERPGASWDELVRAAGFDADRQARLLAGDREALYDLAAELNELRTLPT